MEENAEPKPEAPVDPATATARAAEAVTAQISDLAKQIEAGTLRMKEANERASQASNPEPRRAAPPTEAELTKIADEKGVGAAIHEHMTRTEAPAIIGLLEQNAELRRELVKGDKVLGKVISKYGKEIDAKIRELGLNAAQLAGKAYSDVVRLVAAEIDPAMLIPDKPAPTPTPTPVPKPEPVAPVPPAPVTTVEGVYRGPVAPTPAPNRTVEDEIRAEKVDRREVDFVRDVFDMTESDLKKQRYEVRKLQEKHGEDGLKRMGGTPICSFADIGLPEPR